MPSSRIKENQIGLISLYLILKCSRLASKLNHLKIVRGALYYIFIFKFDNRLGLIDHSPSDEVKIQR